MKDIKIKTYLKKDLPQLSLGEFAWCTDTKELYIGNENENILISKDILNSCSAYELWLKLGNTGSTEDFINFLNCNNYNNDSTSYICKNSHESINEIDTNTDSSCYIIDLAKWNITPGLDNKHEEIIDNISVLCYSNDSYKIAYNNLIGINSAIEYAYSNNFSKVILPKNSYMICYSSEKISINIQNKSNFTFDLNGSTIKCIFDSIKKNPYDLSNNKPYALSGFAMKFTDCFNSCVRNGTLIGDKIDRSFIDQEEKACEGTYGVSVGEGSNNCILEFIDSSFFMGDGITSSIIGNTTNIIYGYQMGWKSGNIDSSGNLISSNKTVVTNLINVTGNTNYYIYGYGYSQAASYFPNERFSVYMYDINKNYIGLLKNVSVLKNFKTYFNTGYIRLLLESSSIDKDGWSSILSKGIVGSNITIRYCKIHHNHRGGLSIGSNNLFIYNNIFYNNGIIDYENNLPGFEQSNGNLFSTRYHINMEDNKGRNTQIYNNSFIGGNIGIALRGSNCIIDRNEFINCGIVLYKIRQAIIENNYGINNSFMAFSYNTDALAYREWILKSNTFSSIVINGNSPIKSISNNSFNSFKSTDALIYDFSNNYIYLNNSDYTSALIFTTNQLITNSTIIRENGTTGLITCKTNNIFFNCSFTNVKLGLGEKCNFNFCIFNSSYLSLGSSNTKFNNCLFNHINPIINVYPDIPNNSAQFNLYNPDNGVKLFIENCEINSSLDSPIFSIINIGKNNNYIIIKNSTITKTNNSKIGLPLGKLYLNDVTISSEVKDTITSLGNSTFKNIILKNITLINSSTDIVENILTES